MVSPWPLHIQAFSEDPVSEWIRKTLQPHEALGIPVEDYLSSNYLHRAMNATQLGRSPWGCH